MPRFRIKTLLAFTAIVAAGVFLWLRYVTPNVAGLGVQGNNLVLYLKPTSALIPFHLDPNDPYALPLPGPAPASAQGEHIFTHDAYVSVPFSAILLLSGIVLLTASSAYFMLRWYVSRRKRLKSSSPNA